MASNTQYRYQIPLADLRDGSQISGTGGSYMVCQAGTAKKQAIYNKAGTQLNSTTPFVALNAGSMEFYVPDTVSQTTGVDIYGMAPDGQFFVKRGVIASGPNQIMVDRGNRSQVALVPFAAVDSTAATEKDTGLDFIVDSVISPFVGLRMITVDATETIDAGILSSETGDADGFLVALPVSSSGTVMAKSASTATRGALIGAGTLDRGYVIASTGVSLSYTLSTGSDTAEGLLILPYTLPFGF
jgi:hypothetical protein